MGTAEGCIRQVSGRGARLQEGKNKRWISDNSWKLIEERNGIKTKIDSTRSERIKNRMKEEYKEKDKQVKKCVREDKRRWMSKKAK